MSVIDQSVKRSKSVEVYFLNACIWNTMSIHGLFQLDAYRRIKQEPSQIIVSNSNEERKCRTENGFQSILSNRTCLLTKMLVY